MSIAAIILTRTLSRSGIVGRLKPFHCVFIFSSSPTLQVHYQTLQANMRHFQVCPFKAQIILSTIESQFHLLLLNRIEHMHLVACIFLGIGTSIILLQSHLCCWLSQKYLNYLVSFQIFLIVHNDRCCVYDLCKFFFTKQSKLFFLFSFFLIFFIFFLNKSY